MKNLAKDRRNPKMNKSINLKNRFILKSVVAGVLVSLFGSASALADDSCFPIDLKSGYIHTKKLPHNVDVTVDPVDSNGDGYYETVLKISLHNKGKKPNHGGARAAVFKVYYDANPTGLTVDIGDSATNNGGGGDAGTQSNDAEATVGGLQSGPNDAFDDLLVFGHDGFTEARGSSIVSQVNNVAKQGETLALAVANERLDYKNKTIPIHGVIESSGLYALNSQPDTEGPINNDVYASFNRVISETPDRFGTGAAKVKVCLLDELPKIDDGHMNDHKDDRKH